MVELLILEFDVLYISSPKPPPPPLPPSLPCRIPRPRPNNPSVSTRDILWSVWKQSAGYCALGNVCFPSGPSFVPITIPCDRGDGDGDGDGENDATAVTDLADKGDSDGEDEDADENKDECNDEGFEEADAEADANAEVEGDLPVERFDIASGTRFGSAQRQSNTIQSQKSQS